MVNVQWLAMQQGVHAAFFELNSHFTPYIQHQFQLEFQLTEQFPTHAERFGGSTNLTDLLSITAEVYDNEENPTLRSGPKR